VVNVNKTLTVIQIIVTLYQLGLSVVNLNVIVLHKIINKVDVMVILVIVTLIASIIHAILCLIFVPICLITKLNVSLILIVLLDSVVLNLMYA
jgi:hypothetical protein